MVEVRHTERSGVDPVPMQPSTWNAAHIVSGIYSGTADPTAGDGVEHVAPAVYLRDNSGTTEVWVATGTDPTDWSKIVSA